MSGTGDIGIVIPVFRDAARAIALVEALAGQQLSAATVTAIVVVDDGSGDATTERIEQALGQRAHVLRLPDNRGRAQARNAGAAMISGDLIMFLDCDSRPLRTDLLELHRRACAQGHVASTGPAFGAGDDFWNRYQAMAMRRRETLRSRGAVFSGSAANLMVRRSTFEQIGGFDPAYREYGFEDRDLLIRLARLGTIAWTPDAGIDHLATLDMAGVAAKLVEAGGPSAAYFSDRHRAEYQMLGYARLDVRLHPWLRLPTRAIAGLMPMLVRDVQTTLAHGWVPFALKAMLVRLVTALSFLQGTSRRWVQRRSASCESRSA